MRNCGRQGRSRNLMLVANLRPKVVLPHGSRLLPGLIVRPHRGLVEAQPHLGAPENRSANLAKRSGGHHPGDTGSVAPLQKRTRLLQIRPGVPALLLSEPALSESAQPQGTGPGAQDSSFAVGSLPRTRRPFGRLPCARHDPHPGDREGEGFSQAALCRASYLRQERLQDRVGLRLQGSSRGGSGRCRYHFRDRCGVLRGATHRGGSHRRRPLRSVPGGQGLHELKVGKALVGGLRSTGSGHPQGQQLLWGSLEPLLELQVFHALEIQPVTPWSVVLADDPDQGVVTRGAAHHRTYLGHVGHLGADLSRRAATGAGGPGRGDLESEDLGQYPCRGVAVEPLFVHGYPPVGPKRSVLTRVGWWPSPTSAVATVSTSGVGPHTKARGPSPGGNATSSSISSSILRS